MRFAASEHNVVVDGGGAVAIAAVLSKKLVDLSGDVALVVSGGNVDMSLLAELLTAAR